MKVNLVQDEKGKVIATYESQSGRGPQLKPELRAGQTIREVEAADDYLKNIAGFYQQHSK